MNCYVAALEIWRPILKTSNAYLGVFTWNEVSVVCLCCTFHFFTKWMIFTWEYINSFAIVMCQSVILIRPYDQMFNVMPLIKFQSLSIILSISIYFAYSICLILLILFVLSIFRNWTALQFPTLSYADFYQVEIVFCYIWNHDFWLMLFFMEVAVVVEFNTGTEVRFHPVGRYVWSLLYVSLYWFYMIFF